MLPRTDSYMSTNICINTHAHTRTCLHKHTHKTHTHVHYLLQRVVLAATRTNDHNNSDADAKVFFFSASTFLAFKPSAKYARRHHYHRSRSLARTHSRLSYLNIYASTSAFKILITLHTQTNERTNERTPALEPGTRAHGCFLFVFVLIGQLVTCVTARCCALCLSLSLSFFSVGFFITRARAYARRQR